MNEYIKSGDVSFQSGDNWFKYRSVGILVEDNEVLFASNENDEYLYLVGGKVMLNESSEEAVVRELLEETGIEYGIDRLAIIEENLFYIDQGEYEGNWHEIAFYYLMKPQGIKEFEVKSYTDLGYEESLLWIPIEDLDKHDLHPKFLKEFLMSKETGIKHIITRNTEDE